MSDQDQADFIVQLLLSDVGKLRAKLAALKLAERGTDNGWVDDDAVEHARMGVLREARAFVQRLDAKADDEPTTEVMDMEHVEE